MQCVRPILVKGNFVPCGKCPNCLANIRQEWIFRLRAEYMQCKFGLFVTMTYDDEHYPATGTSKRDVQLFLKRLRKALGNRSFRYFIVSEYGDHTARGHYHGLFFFQNSYAGFPGRELYDCFVNSWRNGFMKFGDIEEGSIVYCTKYCLKQSPTPHYFLQPFRLMSRNPGIGEWYVDKYADFHASNLQLAKATLNGISARMPRFYRQQIYQHCEAYDVVKLVQDTQNHSFHDYMRQFAAFCRLKKLDISQEASREAFLAHLQARRERQADLVIKHTKKQKF